MPLACHWRAAVRSCSRKAASSPLSSSQRFSVGQLWISDSWTISTVAAPPPVCTTSRRACTSSSISGCTSCGVLRQLRSSSTETIARVRSGVTSRRKIARASGTDWGGSLRSTASAWLASAPADAADARRSRLGEQLARGVARSPTASWRRTAAAAARPGWRPGASACRRRSPGSRSGSRPSPPGCTIASRRPSAPGAGEEEEALVELGHEARVLGHAVEEVGANREHHADGRGGVVGDAGEAGGEGRALRRGRAPACRAPRTGRRRAGCCASSRRAWRAAPCRRSRAPRRGAAASFFCSVRSSATECEVLTSGDTSAASAASGVRPGRITIASHVSPERLSAGTRPARTKDDLPAPEGPTTPISGRSRTRFTSAATSWRRGRRSGRRPPPGRRRGRRRGSRRASVAGVAAGEEGLERAQQRDRVGPALLLVLEQAVVDDLRQLGRHVGRHGAQARHRLVRAWPVTISCWPRAGRAGASRPASGTA